MSSSLEDLRELVSVTIKKTYRLKAFVKSIETNIDKDPEFLSEINEEAARIEEEIFKNIQFIKKRETELSRAKVPHTPKSAELLEQSANTKLLRQVTGRIDQAFRYLWTHKNLGKLSPIRSSTEEALEFLEKRVQAEIKHKDDHTIQLHLSLKFGIKAYAEVQDGLIRKSGFKLTNESLILAKLKSLVESKWKELIESEGRRMIRVILNIIKFVDERQDMFKTKCDLCCLHLSFRTGVPMAPLVVIRKKYYHYECYFDELVS